MARRSKLPYWAYVFLDSDYKRIEVDRMRVGLKLARTAREFPRWFLRPVRPRRCVQAIRKAE
jgi:hypothetical protein